MRTTPVSTAWLAFVALVLGLSSPLALAQSNTTGACCVVNSQGSLVCIVLTQSDCAAIGGQHHGRGTSCRGTNPCPGAPTGACCLPLPGGSQGGGGQSSRQCIILNEVQCAGRGGTYQGNATACTQNACPAPPPPLGACCSTRIGCVLLTSSDCRRQGGNYRGDNTACTPSPCPGAPTGACCLPQSGQGQGGTAVCINLTQLLCQNRGGVYQGDATACTATNCPPPPPGLVACCLGGACQLLTARDCRTQGGATVGHNTSCTPSPCPGAPTGACCIGGQAGGGGGGGGAPRCFVLTEFACRAQGGVYRGDATPCQSISCIPPTIGACCVAVPSGGHQCLQLSALACSSLSGVFSGLGIPCAVVPCPPLPPPCPCDINGDGVVDLADEAAFLAGFAAMNMDLDGDGDTDLDDWNVFYSCYPQGCP